MISNPLRSLDRHVSFLERGGANVAIKSLTERSEKYVGNILTVTKNMFPTSIVPLPRKDHSEIKLEWSSFIFFIFGLITVTFFGTQNARSLVLLPGICIFGGLVISNQSASPWRELVLLPSLLTCSGLGLYFLISHIQRLNRTVSTALYLLVVALQFGFFLKQDAFSTVPGEYDNQGRIAELVRTLEAETPKNIGLKIINTQEGWLLNYIRSFAEDVDRYQLYEDTNEFLQTPIEPNSILITSSGEKNIRDLLLTKGALITEEKEIMDPVTQTGIRIFRLGLNSRN